MDQVMRQDGPRPVAEVVQRAKQLADAIDVAASAGIHHGMMTPCDVIVDGERTGVTWFGLAQALIKAGIPAGAEGPYGSPQRLAGAPPTRADDVYSLAAITLELLIGTPADPEQDTSPALQEARGLPERRRIQRPAPHETRMFTTIAGVDAGKLRAAFAAALSEEPGERPSTASEFVALFEDAVSNKRETFEDVVSIKRETDEPVPSVVPVPIVKPERRDPPSAPALDMTPAEDQFPPEPIDDVPSFEDVTPPPRMRSIDEASYGTPVQSWSLALLVALVVAISFAAGFGGGFIVGQRSTPSIESTSISHDEPVAEPQATRAAVEDPKPIVSATQTVAPVSEKKVSSPEPIAAPVAAKRASPPPIDPGRRRVRATPAEATLSKRRPAQLVEREVRPTKATADVTVATSSTGTLQVMSRPSGAQVFVDDSLIGTTPFLLSNVAAGSKHLRIELSGYRNWTTWVNVAPGARVRVSAGLEP
jgi:serine/threonine protein kinase